MMSFFKYLIGEQQAGAPTVRYLPGTHTQRSWLQQKLKLWGRWRNQAFGNCSLQKPLKRWNFLRLCHQYGHRVTAELWGFLLCCSYQKKQQASNMVAFETTGKANTNSWLHVIGNPPFSQCHAIRPLVLQMALMITLSQCFILEMEKLRPTEY